VCVKGIGPVVKQILIVEYRNVVHSCPSTHLQFTKRPHCVAHTRTHALAHTNKTANQLPSNSLAATNFNSSKLRSLHLVGSVRLFTHLALSAWPLQENI